MGEWAAALFFFHLLSGYKMSCRHFYFMFHRPIDEYAQINMWIPCCVLLNRIRRVWANGGLIHFLHLLAGYKLSLGKSFSYFVDQLAKIRT